MEDYVFSKLFEVHALYPVGGVYVKGLCPKLKLRVPLSGLAKQPLFHMQ